MVQSELFWSFICELKKCGHFQRHGHYISNIFLDLRSSFHIFTMCKSKIIHSHYKAVIMDKPSYNDVYAICLNRLSDIVITVVTDITFFGHYFLHTNTFVEKSEFMDLIKAFSLLNY